MLDSTPKPPPPANAAAALPSANRPPPASAARWWLISLAFHGGLLGWLVFFSPVRFFNPTEKAKVNVSPAQARQIIQEVQARQLPSLEENLRVLADLREQMAGLEKRKQREFAQFAHVLGKGAPEKAAQQQQTIAALQAAALAALDRADGNCTEAMQTRANPCYDELETQQKLAAATQIQVQQLQEKTQEYLSYGDQRYAPALEAQIAANAAQDRAARALTEATAARQPAKNTVKRTERENQLNTYLDRRRHNRGIVTNAPANLQKLQEQVSLSEALLAWAKTNATPALTNATARNTENAKAAADKAKRMVEQAGKDLIAAQKRVENLPRDVAYAQKVITETEANLKHWLAEPEPTPVALSPEEQKLAELEPIARRLQWEAQLAQAAAARVNAAIPPAESNAVFAAHAPTDLNQAVSAKPVPAPKAWKNPSLAQLYNEAVTTEGTLVEAYRRVRATQLAILQDLSLAKAIYLTEVARPERPDLAPELQAPIRSGEQALAVRNAVQTAKAQVSSMVELAKSMLSEAQGLDNRTGTPITLAEINSQFEAMRARLELAAEDNGQRAKNLAAAMAAGSHIGQTGSGSGSTGPALPAGPIGPVPVAGGDNGENTSPGGFERDENSDVAKRVRPLPGRRVAVTAARSPKWLFADSWYIIGPFDNTERRNIDKKFPPETVIDLNATYPGKNGVPVRWEFQQSGAPNVRPEFNAYTKATRNARLTPEENYKKVVVPYCIYYAYTELDFAQACDLWVAIGSDDFSKVWINDYLVWSSGKNLKSWELDEGLRKVHFNQGRNRVFYRVENGNDITEFSLVISLLP